MKVRFAATAEAELEAIGDWIAHDNPVRAVSFIQELRDRCMSLSTRPSRFPQLTSASGRQFHKFVHRNYLIFYEVSGQHVEILRVVHASRDWKALLNEEV